MKKINEDEITQGIGKLCVREKYKFIQNGLIAEIVRDFVEEFNK